jgi:hypothetical protein
MRPGRRQLLGPGDLVPQGLRLVRADRGAQQRPRVRLLVRDVRAGRGGEGDEPLLEALVGGLELVQLGEDRVRLRLLLKPRLRDPDAVGTEPLDRRPLIATRLPEHSDTKRLTRRKVLDASWEGFCRGFAEVRAE